jgi:hypothetical protein
MLMYRRVLPETYLTGSSALIDDMS